MTYCYRCPRCGDRSEAWTNVGRLLCGPCFLAGHDDVYLVRDYRAEAVGVNVANLKAARNRLDLNPITGEP